MFTLHVSNRTENLLAHLCQVIAVAPPADPLAKEVLMVQSHGMARWLAQQLASHFKLWANYSFLFPDAFFAEIALLLDSSLDAGAFQRERLAWRLQGLLARAEGEDFQPLRHYLQGEDEALKRYQLARQIAQLFDQYQLLRTDMLEAWQNGTLLYNSPEERWQRALWLELCQELGGAHRGAAWMAAIRALQDAQPGSLAGRLPERVSLFGLTTLPPLFLAFLQGLARHSHVHLYLLNPAQAYWADLDNQRQLARKGSAADAPLQGHPLLAALGQQGREFQRIMLEQAEFALELESYESDAGTLVLQCLQHDILHNRSVPRQLQGDASLRIHACHSRMREVEVLHDQLLHLLQQNPDLHLRDIAVMAPDIQCYAPLVGAVFADLPHAIADRSLRNSDAVLDAFLAFLRLSQSRFDCQEVLDLLRQPCVHASFDLSETDLQWIAAWVADVNIRWGRSAAHKRQLGLPAFPENTWLAGMQRLLLGYAVGADDAFVMDILPYKHLEGASAQALGGLCDYLQLLNEAAAALAEPRPLTAWAELLQRYARLLFGNAEPALSGQRALLELLGELGNDFGALHPDPVGLPVLLAWLQDAVGERLSASGFLRGQLTFCSMLPMRAIPFQVIALLGLNEGEFPKIDRPPAFDLTARHPRLGDRSRRNDDRYQFLEILLSARRHLLISYVGQSARDNRTIPPSVVIEELLDVLGGHYGLRNIVVRHPLQPFDPRYFSPDSELPSYAASHCQTAQALAAPPSQAPTWWQGSLAAPPEAPLEIAELQRFFRHPQQYFLRQRLGFSAPRLEADEAAHEPFEVAGLDGYALGVEWLAAGLAGQEPDFAQWRAQGRWPNAALGELERRRLTPSLNEFCSKIQAKGLGARLPQCVLDLSVGGYRLVGKLANLYEHGGLFFRPAPLKGKDLLLAWLHHLVANQERPQPTLLLASDADLRWAEGFGYTANLQRLVEIFLLGQTRPDVFFTEAALAYVRQSWQLRHGGKSLKPPLQAAEAQLRDSLENDADLRQALRDRDWQAPVLGEEFAALCEECLVPMWDAAQPE